MLLTPAFVTELLVRPRLGEATAIRALRIAPAVIPACRGVVPAAVAAPGLLLEAATLERRGAPRVDRLPADGALRLLGAALVAYALARPGWTTTPVVIGRIAGRSRVLLGPWALRPARTPVAVAPGLGLAAQVGSGTVIARPAGLVPRRPIEIQGGVVDDGLGHPGPPGRRPERLVRLARADLGPTAGTTATGRPDRAAVILVVGPAQIGRAHV